VIRIIVGVIYQKHSDYILKWPYMYCFFKINILKIYCQVLNYLFALEQLTKYLKYTYVKM